MKSIEFLIDKLDTILPLDFNWDKLEKVFEQAKEMHKEEIMDAFNEGINDECLGKNTTPEEYYNETFKQ